MTDENATKVEEFDKFIDQLPGEVAQSLRFVSVKKNKAADVPEEQDLKKEEFWLDLEGARERLRSGENVGPVLSDQLSVLILMDSEEAQALLEDLPPTLEVSTRSGETHRYYLRGDGIESKDIPGVAELRTGNRYVVAPGCYASNGSGDSWGAYTVEEAREVTEITPDELPPELKPREKLGKEGNDNEHGWRIEKIREEDGVLDGLLTREKPPNLGFMSKEDADKKTIEKLLYWEFPPNVITKIMKEYRNCSEEVASLYTEVFSEFQAAGEDVISDVENVDTFRPGSKREKRLSAGTKKNLEERVFDDDRASWTCDTEFVTFTIDVVLPSGQTVEKGKTYELPSDLAGELRDKEKAGGFVWYCEACGEGPIIEDELKDHTTCPNPNCGKKALKSLHPTEHDKIGDVLMDNYIFRTMGETEQIYFYDGKSRFKKRGAEMFIKSKTKQLLPPCKKHLQTEVVEHIRTSTDIPQNEFGLPKERIAVKNGVLHLTRGELVDLDPRKETPIISIPWSFDPKAKCPKCKKFIEEVVGEENTKLIQEMFGYCLWKDYPFARAFMFLGAGANGKSTLLGLLERFLGNDNVATPSLQKLLESDFASVRLYGKLANVHGDLSNASLEETGAFKKLTGRDSIEGEQKWVQETLDFYNFAKLIYSANELPKTNDRTEAFFRRWVIIPCENHFPEDDPETDPNILEKMTTEEEMSGLLNWAVEGLQRALKNGHLTDTTPQEKIKQKWFMSSDSLRAFTEVAIDEDPSGVIAKKDLQNLYEAFCNHHDLYVAQKAQVTKRLRSIVPAAKGGPGEWYRPKINGDRPRCWVGIAVKDEFLEEKYIQKEGYEQHVRRVHELVTTSSTKKTSKSNDSSNNIGSSSQTLDTLDTVAKERKEILNLLKDGMARSKEEISDELGIPIGRVSDCLRDLYDEGLVEKGGKKLDGGMLYRAVGSDE